MKKTKLTRSLLAACSIVALSVVLSGCLHSGDDTTTTDDTTMMPELTPAEQLAAAQMAVADAEAAVAAPTNSAERAQAYADLAAAEHLLASAEALPENVLADLRQRLADAEDDLDEAEAAATNLRNAIDAVNDARTAAAALGADSDQAAVTAAADLVTAARTAIAALDSDDAARLSSQVDTINDMVTMAQTRLDNAAMVAVATKAAGTKATAIRAEAAQAAVAVDHGLGGSDRRNQDGAEGTTAAPAGYADDPYTLDISRDNDGTEVEITVPGAAMTDPEFMVMMDFGDGRTMHVLSMAADDDGNVMEEVVIVGTDIDPPDPVLFGAFETRAADGTTLTPQALNADAEGAAATGADAVAYDLGSGALVSTTDADAVILGHMMSDSFPPATGGSSSVVHTFLPFAADADPVTDGNQPRAAAMVEGTYNGAMGTYTCSGTADCTVTVDDEGNLTAATDGWIFTPATGATSDQPDYDYLSYGFWLERTKNSDDMVTAYGEVETFAMATGYPGDPTTDMGNVLGTATYTGGSVGVYVMNELDGQGNIVTATSGHFNADVTLNASFGGSTVIENSQFTIGGMINNFTLTNSFGTNDDNDWSVTLGLADFSGRAAGNEPGSSAPASAYSATFSGSATGDMAAAAGSWNGMFHGASADNTATADNTDDHLPPPAITGEFNANFTNGTVAGGFGATTGDE